VSVVSIVLRRGIVLLALVGLLSGCGGDFPPWSAPAPTAPIAVRMSPTGQVEALLVPCTPVRIARLEVTAPREAVQAVDDPQLWQVDFAPPTTNLHTVVLGETPPGGAVRVPWPTGGLSGQEAHSFVVRVVLADGGDWWIGFQPEEDLADGQVRFQERNMTPEAFAEQSRCG
jgi:hypothetical protein